MSSDLDEQPSLLVVVDTEEEFDWDQGFHREATSVMAMDEIGRFQEVCDAFGIRPTYVVDYPVAAQERGVRSLRAIHDAGRAEIGAHLHPWVTPPFVEDVSAKNSYPGNLPPDVERAKIASVTEAIQGSFGARPRVYRAGRYGIGPRTPGILLDLGFEVDTSICPAFDFRADGGPDHSSHSSAPRWLAGTLLELPNTAGYTGAMGGAAGAFHRLASRPAMERMRLPGILARLRLAERILLSPEGYELDELRRLTTTLRRAGLRIFTLSLHSPSLKPGCTPYVRTADDRARFLDRCKSYFRFFLEELGGVASSHRAIRDRLLARGEVAVA